MKSCKIVYFNTWEQTNAEEKEKEHCLWLSAGDNFVEVELGFHQWSYSKAAFLASQWSTLQVENGQRDTTENIIYSYLYF